MRRTVTLGLAIGGLAAVILGALCAWWWASSGWDGDDPSSAARAEIVSTPDAQSRVAPTVLKILSWNVAFGGGTGGQADVHDADEVRRNLAALARQIRQADPDVVFLQEVDRPSHRTGNVDEFEELRAAAGFPYGCYVTTWRQNYLPYPYWPPSRHIGRIHSGQAVLSHFPIESCERRPMPQPPGQPGWYNRSYLHRSLQGARLRLPGDRPVDLVNVHLEAYSQENREAQARTLAEWVAGRPASVPLIVAGDFNAVPPGASRKSGFADEDADFTTDRTIEIVRVATGLREVFLDDVPDAPEEATWTFPSTAVSRRLDYVFARGFGPGTQRGTIRTDASDHRGIEAALPIPVVPVP